MLGEARDKCKKRAVGVVIILRVLLCREKQGISVKKVL